MTAELFVEGSESSSDCNSHEDISLEELRSTHTRIGDSIADAQSGRTYDGFVARYDELTNTATWEHSRGGVDNRFGGSTVTASQRDGITTFTIAQRVLKEGNGHTIWTKSLVLARSEGRITTSAIHNFGRGYHEVVEPTVTRVFGRDAYNETLNDLIELKAQSKAEVRTARRGMLGFLLRASAGRAE